MSGFSAALLLIVAAVARAAIPSIELNNGVQMPMMSLGTGGYNDSIAEEAVQLALQLGFNHIDTAREYENQKGISRALKNRQRSTFFLTTKVPSGDYNQTKAFLDEDMLDLGLDYVDLMLVHYPPKSNDCSEMQSQWKAMEEFYKAGRAKAIGVSQYCISSLKCIAQTSTVAPAVNQIGFHVGIGPDPTGLKSYGDSQGIVTQSFSPLCGWGCSSTTDLINGNLVVGIGKAYNVSGAQVSLRWIVQTGVPLATKSNKESHLKEDLAVFDFSLTDTDKDQLDAATSPSGKPSAKCTSEERLVV